MFWSDPRCFLRTTVYWGFDSTIDKTWTSCLYLLTIRRRGFRDSVVYFLHPDGDLPRYHNSVLQFCQVGSYRCVLLHHSNVRDLRLRFAYRPGGMNPALAIGMDIFQSAHLDDWSIMNYIWILIVAPFIGAAISSTLF